MRVSLAYRGNQARVQLLDRCRALRQSSTDAEGLLWRLLRARQVAGAKFRRQHQFGPFILDFYCVELRLAIEADGGQHRDPSGVTRDEARRRYLEHHGVRMMRFSDREVLLETEAVVMAIWEEAVRPSPPALSH